MDTAGLKSMEPDDGKPSRNEAIGFPDDAVVLSGSAPVKRASKLKEPCGALGCNSPIGIWRKSIPNFTVWRGRTFVRLDWKACVLSARWIKSDVAGAIARKPEGWKAGIARKNTC